MATEDKYYTHSKKENKIELYRLGLKFTMQLAATGIAAISTYILGKSIRKLVKDPDGYWEIEDKKGNNSAHVIANGMHDVADAIRSVNK